jgi:hypothetical protein
MTEKIKEYTPKTSRLLKPVLEFRVQLLARWYRHTSREQLTYFTFRHRYSNLEELRHIDLDFIQHFVLSHEDRGVYAKPIERFRYKQIRCRYNEEVTLALHVMRALKQGENVLPHNKAYVEKYYGCTEADLGKLDDLFH